MAKDKERNINPAQAQRKADKAKALKKSRNEQQAKRNEKLARRNPDRIQRQIDDLKALESSGEIKSREKAILADLERDLKAIRKAKESLGDKIPASSSNQRQQYPRQGREESERSVLGKRRHDGQRKPHQDNYSSGSETDESVRRIPMPRDTPPPPPRSSYRNHRSSQDHQHRPAQHDLPAKPQAVYESKTTYSSAPQLRDLKKEAVSRFVPDIVRRKQDAVRGEGGLLEPEEFDRLEREGYYTAQPERSSGQKNDSPVEARTSDSGHEDPEARRLRAEEARFQQELEAEPMNDVDEETHDTRPTVHNAGRDGNTEDAENEEDEEEDDYLPPLMSGKGMLNRLSTSQLQSPQQPNTFISDGAAMASGLFSRLPQPRHQTVAGSKHVRMEEIEDEDI